MSDPLALGSLETAAAGGGPAGRGWVLRFDAVERAAHWANASLFLVLVATALPLYFPAVEAVVGRRALVADVHTWCGVALPVPLALALAGPWGARLRRDLRRMNRWGADELRWLRSAGTRPVAHADKFNPGQKLFAAFTAGSILVMLASGAVLRWFRPFPLGFRTGATFVHDVLATAIVVAIVGHVLVALAHPSSLRSMVTGRVSTGWARRHAPAWLEEQQRDAYAAGRP
ncbi:MAG: cytochrome b/b6 domain-containing protein [Actinomycetota bacterium]|nr:cytochrome b/b6 domain-containing protein [Actinomycetota bacterium]